MARTKEQLEQRIREIVAATRPDRAGARAEIHGGRQLVIVGRSQMMDAPRSRRARRNQSGCRPPSRGHVTGTVIDHLDSPSCFGLYFSIHSCSLKTLGTSM
jgi:hypothetical protein